MDIKAQSPLTLLTACLVTPTMLITCSMMNEAPTLLENFPKIPGAIDFVKGSPECAQSPIDLHETLTVITLSACVPPRLGRQI